MDRGKLPWLAGMCPVCPQRLQPDVAFRISLTTGVCLFLVLAQCLSAKHCCRASAQRLTMCRIASRARMVALESEFKSLSDFSCRKKLPAL